MRTSTKQTFCLECDEMVRYELSEDCGDWTCTECGFAIDCVECGQTMNGSHRCVSERCPLTGRSASACDTPDHRNCPDLQRGGE